MVVDLQSCLYLRRPQGASKILNICVLNLASATIWGVFWAWAAKLGQHCPLGSPRSPNTALHTRVENVYWLH